MATQTKEQIAARRAKYYQDNKAKIRLKRQLWLAANPDYYKEYYKDRPDYYAKRAAEHPEYKENYMQWRKDNIATYREYQKLYHRYYNRARDYGELDPVTIERKAEVDAWVQANIEAKRKMQMLFLQKMVEKERSAKLSNLVDE